MPNTADTRSGVVAPPPAPPPVIPRGLALLLGAAALLLVAQGIQPIQTTVAATFMALNLVIVVWPIQPALTRLRVPRFLASTVAGLAAIAILGALIWSLAWTVGALVAELPKYSTQFYALINQAVDFAQSHGIDTKAVLDNVPGQIMANLSTLGHYATTILNNVTSAAGLTATIVLLLIFMIVDSTDFSERMTRLGERHNPTLAWALGSFAQGTRRYWIVASVFGLIVSAFDWVLLAALGVPLALVWAIWAFVTNYVPNIGFILGIIPPVIMALLANSPMTALWVIVGYCVINFLIQSVIQPRFTGASVGITTTAAMLSLLLWTYVLGGLGTILAIPATLLVKTLFIDIDPKARWLNAFIASNPTTSDQDPIRLSVLLDRAKKMRRTAAGGAKKNTRPGKGVVVAPGSGAVAVRGAGPGAPAVAPGAAVRGTPAPTVGSGAVPPPSPVDGLAAPQSQGIGWVTAASAASGAEADPWADPWGPPPEVAAFEASNQPGAGAPAVPLAPAAPWEAPAPRQPPGRLGRKERREVTVRISRDSLGLPPLGQNRDSGPTTPGQGPAHEQEGA